MCDPPSHLPRSRPRRRRSRRCAPGCARACGRDAPPTARASSTVPHSSPRAPDATTLRPHECSNGSRRCDSDCASALLRERARSLRCFRSVGRHASRTSTDADPSGFRRRACRCCRRSDISRTRRAWRCCSSKRAFSDRRRDHRSSAASAQRSSPVLSAMRVTHASHASQKEQDLIAALTRRYSDDPGADLKKLASNYSIAMRDVYAKYPNDDNIGTLYAESLMDLHPWKFWTHDGQPNENTEEIVRVLEGVLKRNPNHIGANHYYIHAVEASSHPERAVKSAERLKTLAPSAGHLVHMPAHILERTGDFAGAAAANAAGAKADRAFMAKYGAESMYAGMYYNHNLDFGATSYMMIGDFAHAKEAADEVSSNAAKMAAMMPMIEGASSDSLKVLLRFGKWNDMIEGKFETPGPMSTAWLHFARGVSFARLGNIDGAQSEQKAFDEARSKISADETGVFQNPEQKVLDVAAEVLNGRIATARGDHAGAIAAYRKAVTAEDALDYDEPADWFYPTRESLGAALLRDKQYAEAEKVFREDLERNKNNPRSLYGLFLLRSRS